MNPDEETSGGPPNIPPEVYRTLESLDDLVDEPTQVLGRATSISVEEFLALTERLREQLPREIRQAEDVRDRVSQTLEKARADADTILRETQKETERIVEAAHKRAVDLVENSPEVQFANAQHRDITAQAQQAANNARQDADDYAREVLNRLEEYVSKLQNQVRSGLVALDREHPRAGSAPRT